jgi:hypothetical protein
MINKIQIFIAGICILLATIAAWKVAQWKYQQETLQCKVDCQKNILEVADQQKEIFITNEKTIIKSKKISRINHSIGRDELIDKL